MTTQRDPKSDTRRKKIREGGFTLVEVFMAIVVLLVGIVAVAQLVPASISSNSTNRNDSSALVFAQREMDQFLGQPLNMALAQPAFIDALGFSCDLGNPGLPANEYAGSPIVLYQNQMIIDFTQSVVSGYHFTYQDPNDPTGVVYDVRWAVFTTTNNGLVTSKRFIMGARKEGGNGIYKPVTLDTILEK